ncbi:MAG TPA: ATP-dependent helicase [Burkholderiales bacterium]|nr:ATP-dependent helicase [Burkholderiales bacterium]
MASILEHPAAERHWLDDLNAAQRAAATYGSTPAKGPCTAGPLLIIAGAGTGKTNTLAHRVAHLVLNGVAPERILLLTFSRRASQEMIRRARRIVGKALTGEADARKAPAVARLTWAGTFHSVANRLLRRYAQEVGLTPGFSVMDRGDSADLLDLARQELALSSAERRFPRKDTCLAIYSHCTNTGFALERTLAEVFPWCASWHDDLKRLFARYVGMKLTQQVLDFDDLLVYWHALMQEPALAAEVGSLYDHVLVDEYQDTNTLQAEILLALKPAGAGLCVVGDDAQSIYGFRAATVENILGFPAQFSPPADVVTLEENYRSKQPILDAANALIGEASRQYQKRLQSCRGSGNRPRLVTVLDEQAQADYLVERILDAREQGVALKRQAVLFRSSHHSDTLELELVRRNIPYVKYGGLKFLEAAHVKDLLAVLRWADNPLHRIAGFRVLQLLPGIGPSSAERCLAAFEAASHDWSALADYKMPLAAREDWSPLLALLRDLAPAQAPWEGQVGRARRWYEPHLNRLYDAAMARAGDLEQLERISAQFGTREQFLSELTLDPPRATGDLAGPPLLDEDYLVLSTIHSAKGQEWDRVSILHVTDGTFPSEFATGKAELIEEERRLLYVAMTRAKDELDLVTPLKYYVTHQTRQGDTHVYGTRSRFLTPAVTKTLDLVTWPPDARRAEEPPAAKALPRIDVAARMRTRWA